MAVARRTESGYQRTILQLARLLGWRCAHFRPGLTRKGWRTPVQGDGVGFPDLVLLRGERLLFVELKGRRGVTSPEQRAWLDALRRVPGAEVYEWRDGVTPWREVEGVLR